MSLMFSSPLRTSLRFPGIPSKLIVFVLTVESYRMIVPLVSV